MKKFLIERLTERLSVDRSINWSTFVSDFKQLTAKVMPYCSNEEDLDDMNRFEKIMDTLMKNQMGPQLVRARIEGLVLGRKQVLIELICMLEGMEGYVVPEFQDGLKAYLADMENADCEGMVRESIAYNEMMNLMGDEVNKH